jgi:uncharacterized BrkB/YihY/UPF0761 family membrane protein
MADIAALGNTDGSVEFMVAAGLVFEIIAAACSSPQTTEINAGVRADTLMKWVIVGMAMSAVFVGIAAMMSKKKWPPLLGGGLAGAMLWAAYSHAKAAGLKNGGPTTESY